MRVDRLRDARKRKGLKQEEIAKKLGVARTTYAGYEADGANHRDPDDETKVQIAQILEVTTDYLLGNSDLPHLTEAQSKGVRTLKDIRYEIENDLVVDIDKKPFTPERKEESLRQIDILIRLRETEGYKK